jgi:putative transposase
MVVATKTLKLAFHRLNQTKAAEFARLEAANTQLANRILALPKAERGKLTTAAFPEVEIGSGWVNQTIRNTNARTKIKRFARLPLETNNQNWRLHKVGDTYSVAFGLLRGIKKRVPLAVSNSVHQEWLDAILSAKAKPGSIKLSRSRRGVWYVLISVSMDVPDAVQTGKWIGVDRGQNIPAVAALPDNGRLVFFQAKCIQHMRRENAKRRKKLQRLGKHRTVRKMEQRERRTVTHINHRISKQIVDLAERNGCGIRLEDLSGIRKTAKQRKTTKSDAGKNRDYWPFFQLETFCLYKSKLRSVATEKVEAPYTSKTHHTCGRIGVRNRHDFYCAHCDEHEHADGNAARNIGAWVGMFCAIEPSKGVPVEGTSAPSYGRSDTALNSVSNANSQGLAA